jgi:pyruvate kinase
MYTQSHAPVKAVFPTPAIETVSRQLAISRSIISLTDSIGAAAIVAETKSGATAIQIAAERCAVPIIVVTDDQRTAQQLAIVYNVKSYVRPASKLAATKLTDFLHETGILKKGHVVVTVSGQYPGVVGTTDTIKVRQLN